MRLAVQHWIQSEARLLRVAAEAVKDPAKAQLQIVEDLLTPEQLQIFKKYKMGQATPSDLFAVGVKPKTILALMNTGEM